MNEQLSPLEAQNFSFDVLENSLAVLPAGARLDRVHPDFPHAQLSFAKFEPSYDDNTTIDGPHRFSVAFWVVDGGDGRAALERLVRRWTSWGWFVDDRSGGDLGFVRATSFDGYRLVARLSMDGEVSLGVSSPSFPFENCERPGQTYAPGVILQS